MRRHRRRMPAENIGPDHIALAHTKSKRRTHPCPPSIARQYSCNDGWFGSELALSTDEGLPKHLHYVTPRSSNIRTTFPPSTFAFTLSLRYDVSIVATTAAGR